MTMENDLVGRPRCGKPGCGALKLIGNPCTDWDGPQTYVSASDYRAAADRIQALEAGLAQSIVWSDKYKEDCEVLARWHTEEQARAERAEAKLARKTEALPDLSSVISWLENGCDPNNGAKELRIYAARIAAALEEKTDV